MNAEQDPTRSDSVAHVATLEPLARAIERHLVFTIGKDARMASPRDWLYALATAVRDRLVERWMDTTRRQYAQDVKRVYYLSMEFLPGRLLGNALLALDLDATCSNVLQSLSLDLDELAALEPDPALGNGGLGRLAACYLDSMATLDLPGVGYGIRYEYGMFAQEIRDGRQVEVPDHWLVAGNPWEFPRPEVKYRIQFGGRVEYHDRAAHWVETKDVLAMAYDTLVPGYGTSTVNTLRLWSAVATEAFDLALFNRGDYAAAIEDRNNSENVSRVLYPDDSTTHGRELRLRQEYFFVSASLQDLLRRYFEQHRGLEQLPEKVAIHLNDTHPALAIPEMMRLLLDVHHVPWTLAWKLCTRIFSYTNHTLMPEALETWPVELMERVLPRHMKIVYDINELFLDQLRRSNPDDLDLLRRMSLIDEHHGRRVRMAELSVLASQKVNGVSRLHTELLRTNLFPDFDRLFPGRFVNQTNGVTPRRWLAQANPGLAALIDRRIGTGWRTRLDELAMLAPLAADARFCAEFDAVKAANKQRLAQALARATGATIRPDSLFDVQIKRIHEYKRQLLNVLHVITRYHRILAEPDADWMPRTVIFAGKAASAYAMAKLIIWLVNDVARTINSDPRVGDRLRVAFMPNYGVSAAMTIIPAADLSEQISTAGTEASGTGNMKLALNGALTIGTEDGANIEIRDAVGAGNIFIFGHTAGEVRHLRASGYDPRGLRDEDAGLAAVLEAIGSGAFSAEEPDRYAPIVRALLDHGDHYLLLADYASYVAAQERVDARYRDRAAWTSAAVRNVAAMGGFSSDRAVRDYADAIWRVRPLTP